MHSVNCLLAGVHAVGLINEAVDKGDPAGTLESLKLPSAQLKSVDNKQAMHYQTLLAAKKKQRQEVQYRIICIHSVISALHAYLNKKTGKRTIFVVFEAENITANQIVKFTNAFHLQTVC